MSVVGTDIIEQYVYTVDWRIYAWTCGPTNNTALTGTPTSSTGGTWQRAGRWWSQRWGWRPEWGWGWGPASGPAGSAAPLADHSCVMPAMSTANPACAEVEGGWEGRMVICNTLSGGAQSMQGIVGHRQYTEIYLCSCVLHRYVRHDHYSFL